MTASSQLIIVLFMSPISFFWFFKILSLETLCGDSEPWGWHFTSGKWSESFFAIKKERKCRRLFLFLSLGISASLFCPIILGWFDFFRVYNLVLICISYLCVNEGARLFRGGENFCWSPSGGPEWYGCEPKVVIFFSIWTVWPIELHIESYYIRVFEVVYVIYYAQ